MSYSQTISGLSTFVSKGSWSLASQAHLITGE